MVFAPDIFRGSAAIVTGGGTGIGRETALLLARLGAAVAIGGRRQEPLDKTGQDLIDLAGRDRVFFQACDIREPDAVEAFVEGAMGKLGKIDLLVNNAGGQFPSPALNLSPNGFAAVVRNNLNGTFFMTREVAKRSMVPQRKGRIVNVIAQIFRGFPGMVHTGAARAGVENMTMTLAVEWAEYNINVNAIAPGTIRTSGTDQYPPELLEMARQRTPAKRFGTAEEIAQSIIFLLSPATQFMTGSTLYIDGGARLWGESWPIPDHGSNES